MMNNLLFIYGTLLSDDNEYGAYLKSNSSFYAPGKLKGKLFDIGDYPGAVLSADTDHYIYGNILKIEEFEKVLPVIDDYEGIGPEQPQPNEFIRFLAEIETGEELITCWIYLYNLPVTRFPQIESGRYHK
jgi:gamma-glutamylcyclotransferase (GGCT)/AIG2-like uncharacterized protein YtfP